MDPDSLKSLSVSIDRDGFDTLTLIAQLLVAPGVAFLAARHGAIKGGELAAEAGTRAIREEFDREQQLALDALLSRIAINLPRIPAACARLAGHHTDNAIPLDAAEELEVVWNTYLRRSEEHIARLGNEEFQRRAERVFADAHILAERAKKVEEFDRGIDPGTDANSRANAQRKQARVVDERAAILEALAKLDVDTKALQTDVDSLLADRHKKRAQTPPAGPSPAPAPELAPPPTTDNSRTGFVANIGARWAQLRALPRSEGTAYAAFFVGLTLLYFPPIGTLLALPLITGAFLLRVLGGSKLLTTLEGALLVMVLAQVASARTSMYIDGKAAERTAKADSLSDARLAARDKAEDDRRAAERRDRDEATVTMIVGALRFNIDALAYNDTALVQELEAARRGGLRGGELRTLDGRWWDVLAADPASNIMASPGLLNSLRDAAGLIDATHRMIDLRAMHITSHEREGGVMGRDIRWLRQYDEQHIAHGRRVTVLSRQLVARLEGLQ